MIARRLVATAALLAVSAPTFGSAARAAQSARAGARAEALAGDPVSGSSAYVHGALVWTGYPYRDRAVTYPAGLSNAANIVQLQLGLRAGRVHVHALLETLQDPRVPVLGVAFDTDTDPATGARALPGGRWTPAGALGVEVLAILHGGSGQLLAWDGRRWVARRTFPVRADTATDTIDAVVPLVPSRSARWRVFAVAGAAGADGRSWVDGSQPVADVAFVGGEPPANWQHQRSDAVLAGNIPSSAAAGTVDWAAIRSRRSERVALGPGFHTLVYRSRLLLGEGIGTATLTLPGGGTAPLGSLYAGPYQPYLVWVPPHLDRPTPLIVYMHGFTQTHLDNATSFGPAIPNPSPSALLLGNGGFDPPAVVAFPLGRGENTFYFGAAEQDVLDVTDDAVARFVVDPRRVVLSGVSMGGFGTYRIGVRYPDRWAALVPFIGTGGSPQFEFGAVPRPARDELFSPTGFPTGNAELLENLADTPIRMINGQIDPLVDNVLVSQDTLRLQQLGYDYRSWVLLRRQHEVVPSLSNCVLLEALTHRLVSDPPRVVLSVEPSMSQRDAASGLDLHYDHAFWVRGVTVRPGADKGTVDVTSLARGDRGHTASQLVDAGENLTAGADLCGPDPAVRTGDAWRELGLELTPASPLPTTNAVRATLTMVDGVTIDVARAGVRATLPVTLTITGDGITTVRLAGRWPAGAIRVFRDGRPAGTVRARGGDVTLRADFTGTHTYRLVVRAPSPG